MHNVADTDLNAMLSRTPHQIISRDINIHLNVLCCKVKVLIQLLHLTKHVITLIIICNISDIYVQDGRNNDRTDWDSNLAL